MPGTLKTDSRITPALIKRAFLTASLLAQSVGAFAGDDRSQTDAVHEKSSAIPQHISPASTRVGYDACRTLLSEANLDPDVYFYYGRIHYFWGETEGAEEAFQKAAEQGYPVAHYFLGSANLHGCTAEQQSCAKKTLRHLREAASGGVRGAVELLALHGEQAESISPSGIVYQHLSPEYLVFHRP